MRSKLEIIIRFFSGIDKFISFPSSYQFYDVSYIQKYIEPGYIILIRKEWQLSNLFIPGKWKHAAFCNDQNYAIEAVGEGVRRVFISDLLQNSDNFCVLKPIFCSKDDIKTATLWAENQVGKPYDFRFEGCNRAFYCTELIVHAYSFCKGFIMPRRRFLGDFLYFADDFYKDKTQWEVAYIARD